MKVLLSLALAAQLWAQRESGELRITVADSSGLPLVARGELSSRATQANIRFQTGTDGRYAVRRIPIGVYRLTVTRDGLAPYRAIVDIRSEIPVEKRVTLRVGPVQTNVQVSEEETLIDPYRPGVVSHVGSEQLRERRSAMPGREVLQMVENQPGWLLEANGILHPRGSEYDTQYIIDGAPLTDNRSPGFAPALEVEELQSMRVFTAGYPAEYGRKLGGVVEVATQQDRRPGWRGKASLQRGSFATRNGYAAAQWSNGRTAAGGSVLGTDTRRYLDPPVRDNFSNRGSSEGATGRVEHDFTQANRLRLYGHRKRTAFLVPNEIPQQEAGQRQDRRASETLGLASYEHVISPRVLAAVRGMVRDVSAELWSNPLATPILASQDRGFREGYAHASVAAQLGGHHLKAGTEVAATSVREAFAYRITDPDFFDDEVIGRFSFAGRARGREHSGYAQDLWRAGRLTVSAGVRWDRYRLLVRESAWSPRLGLAYHIPEAGLALRASYDRVFQTPASENLLLASSREARSLTDDTTELPIPPSRGNFYQAGASKSLFGRLRIDAAVYRRDLDNFADDDVLLNTGVSFPIAFSKARIQGFETKLEVPRWGPISGYVSYSNLNGAGWLPITGGLFLDEESAELLASRSRFRITQDQRNTVQTRWRWQIAGRLWAAVGAWYASGLPLETDDEIDLDDLEERFSRETLDRVDFTRGRVRPSHSVDLSAGVLLWSGEGRSLRLQADVLNVTGRFNVINFAGLFSGTALGMPRTGAIRLQAEF